MTTSVSAPHDSPIAQSWRLHGAALLFLVLLILFEFRAEVVAATQVWWVYETYSHCFLIIPISLWLIYEKREQLRALKPAVELRALWAVPLLLLLWGAGELATINEVRQFAVVGLLEIAVLAMLGAGVFRVIWFPLLYLFFLVPTGQYLIAPMQRFATLFVDLSLNLIGIPHHTEGTLVELSNGSFEIAEACAGLRFLIATIALGVLFAYLMFRKWYKIVLFLFASIAVPLIGNGLRIVGIILLAHFTNNKYGVGVDHIVYGWGFNVAILLILFLLGSFFRDTGEVHVAKLYDTGRADTSQMIVVALVAASLLISIGPAVAFWLDNRAPLPSVVDLRQPSLLRGWRVTAASGNWRPKYPDTDASITESLRPDRLSQERLVDLYVGYYAQARTGHALTAHLNYLWNPLIWTQVGSDTVVARIGGREVRMQEWIVSSVFERRMIWTCYWVDGDFTSKPLVVKLLQARAILAGHEGQALVAVSTVVDSTDQESRHRLSNALTALGDLPERLEAANHRGGPPVSN